MRDLSVKNVEYHEVGFAVVDDVADPKTAAMTRELFESSDYDYMVQTRTQHYSHVFKSNDPELPGAGEVYSARFFRSATVERSELIKNLVETHIQPCVSDVTKLDCKEDFSYEHIGSMPVIISEVMWMIMLGALDLFITFAPTGNGIGVAFST